MDVVEILLFCVVGFSVLVFLLLDNLDSLGESRKNNHHEEKSSDFYDSVCKTRTGSSSVESLEEEKSVGAEDFDETGEIATAAEEEKEAENPVDVISEKSCFCSAIPEISENNTDDNCRKGGISEDNDGELKDEFIDDDWEGVERTELEKIFGEAVVFVNSMSNADQIEDINLQLYGLQKVALEGTCHGSQPIALKVSARSKWNAWQKVGNMGREMAMEKYVEILTKAIPGWKVDKSYTSSYPVVES